MRFALAFLAGLLFANSAAASVTTANVNCRERPATSSTVVERIGLGRSVDVLSRVGAWAMLDRPQQCWVSRRFLSEASAYVSSARRSTYPRAETKRANRYSLRSTRRYASTHGYASPRRRARTAPIYNVSCPCSGASVCIGPRGGRYCITSGGNKRYGV